VPAGELCICADCDDTFEQISGQGRPRKYCYTCGDKTPRAHRRWRANHRTRKCSKCDQRFAVEFEAQTACSSCV